jgi:hypothetical protein
MNALKYIIFCIALCFVSNTQAQNFEYTDSVTEFEKNEGDKTFTGHILERTAYTFKALGRGVEYSLRAGYEIGGTSPMPLPAEIRKIESFKPKMHFYIEGNVNKTFKRNRNWGLLLGIRLEQKGMETQAQVKNYNMRMDGGDGTMVEGAFTGHVITKVNNSYLSIPLLVTCKVTDRWKLRLGPYYSHLLGKDFSGKAMDGYLREGDPTGDYVAVSTADYDFSNDLRKWNIGVQFGADWKVLKHLAVALDLQWGLNDIFKKDFEVIKFDMYPIYGTIGIAYLF